MTSTTPITLRPAAPTIEEGLVFARLLEDAQEGKYRAMLGRRAMEIIAEAYTHPDHALSFEYVTFAEQDGRIVGMASGYSSEEHARFGDELMETAGGWSRSRFAVCARLARRVVQFIDTVHDGDFYVRGVAVDSARRGEGIGTRLIRSVEETARAVGSKRLALDVAAKNRGARRLYGRLGMAVEAESPRWFGLPDTNLIRMAKGL